MDISKKHFIIEITLILIIALSSFSAGLMLSFDDLKSTFRENFKPSEVSESEEEIISNCEGLGDVERTALCLRDNVEPFYNYSVTDERHYDLETLKEKGGDCYNYAKFYEKLAEELGYKATTDSYEGKEEIGADGHMWTLMWD
ncbi:MAG: hypothetical protein ACOCRX_07685, partial [Candidatus Woesearchaeota archaeon]